MFRCHFLDQLSVADFCRILTALKGCGDAEKRRQNCNNQGHHCLRGQHAWGTGILWFNLIVIKSCNVGFFSPLLIFYCFQFIAKEELEKNERTQMKQLTLEINERQEEEELQVRIVSLSMIRMSRFLSVDFRATCINSWILSFSLRKQSNSSNE